MRGLRFGLTAILGLGLLNAGGCGFFPNSGPESWEIHSGVSEIPYALVKLTPETIDVIAAHEPKGLAGAFTDKRPPKEIVFGIGDVVDVTVFEAAAGGLFVPLEAGVRPGNFVTFPPQIVDNNGNITIPYAGLIRAAGRTNVQIQNDIIDKIKNRAIEPQVIVALEQQRSQLISVIGDVHAPLRFATPMPGARDRVLDAITRAGGIASPGFATWVMLERDGKRATVPFENLVMTASNNIYVRPGDRIYVYTEAQKILAFGELGGGGGGSTAGAQAEIPFETWRMNLAEALGKGGGAFAATADPGAVFIYRKEPREIAQLLGADMTKFEGPLVPVIFWINLRDPGGFFLSTRFQMRNDDILFVASAASTETAKFLTYVGLVASTATAVMGTVQSVPITSAIVRGHAFGATAVLTTVP